MNDLVFFGIIILILIRLIGIIVSVDFYYDSRSKTYIYFGIGWSLWFTVLIFVILSEIASNQMLEEFFLLMNYILGPVAMLLILTGLSSHYIKISPFKIVAFLIFLIITPLIVYFAIGLNFVYMYSRIVSFSSYFILFFLPIIKLKNFKEKIGKSIRWYYLICFSILFYIPLSIFLLINNESYGLFQSEDVIIIILAYIPVILTTILIIAFMIHLEYNISYEQKKALKDKYSHNLGNILQAIEGAHFLTKEKKNLDNNSILEVENIIEKKFKEAAEMLKEIRKL